MPTLRHLSMMFIVFTIFLAEAIWVTDQTVISKYESASSELSGRLKTIVSNLSIVAQQWDLTCEVF